MFDQPIDKVAGGESRAPAAGHLIIIPLAVPENSGAMSMGI
jgi:hypothetical protein